MVVRAKKPRDRKIKEAILRTLFNYLKSFFLLRIEALPARFILSISLVLFLNLSTSLIVLGLTWNLFLYSFLILIFSLINCLLLSLSEGTDVSRLPMAVSEEEEVKEEILCSPPDKPEDRMNILVPILYFYITLLSLTYLPFYILLSNHWKFIKPVALILFMGLYNIFFLNNCNRGAISQILNAMSIFIFVYLCIDRIEI